MTCQTCKSERIMNINAKCSDSCSAQIQNTSVVGYAPRDLNIGGGDYIRFRFCLECGQIQGKWPVVSELEKKQEKIVYDYLPVGVDEVLVGNVDTNGTCLQGYVCADYAEMEELFGPQTSDGDGYKVDAEWEIGFKIKGLIKVATIYNYKDGPNYNDGTGSHPRTWEKYDWHIGGDAKDVVKYIQTMIDNLRS